MGVIKRVRRLVQVIERLYAIQEPHAPSDSQSYCCVALGVPNLSWLHFFLLETGNEAASVQAEMTGKAVETKDVHRYSWLGLH